MRALVDRLIISLGVILVAGFFGASLYVIGVASYLVFQIGCEISRAYVLSNNWQVNTATIISSQAAPHTGRRPSHCLEVNYHYTLDGINYSGNRVWFGLDYCSDKASVEAKASEFIPGVSQPVYINPQAKNDAVLVRGVTLSTPIAFVMLTVFPIAAAWWMANLLLRKRTPAGRGAINPEEMWTRREMIDRAIRVDVNQPTQEKPPQSPPENTH